MPGNQEKITRHTKRQKTQFEETKEAQEPNTAGMLELSDQEFKTGFPGGSDSKESTCNAGDLGSIPESKDPLEEEMATHSSILAWRIPMVRGAWRAIVHGVTKSQTQLSD